MSVSITGKLNKAASEFAAGESVGFGLRLGQQYYDRETKQKEWTNYECAIFAKAPAQIEFYRQAFIEGAIVEVLGKRQKIRSFEGNNGTILSIEIIDASLESVNFVKMDDQVQAPQQPAPQPQTFSPQNPAGAPALDLWEDYIPAGQAANATIEQIKKKAEGNLETAKANGWVAFDDGQIPF